MQIRDLIAELQRYRKDLEVKIAVRGEDDTDFEDIADIKRKSMVSGNFVVLHPYDE